MRTLILILTAVLVLAGESAGSEIPSREQALHELAAGDALTRRAAVVHLGEAGTTEDVPLLVQALRDTDADVRRDAELAMWRIWSRSGDAQIDALYQAGIEQIEGGKLHQAIATFTRVIEMKPEFAEGWNKRATLYFLIGDYRKSLVDCDEVIKRNPYHFGALAGYAQIYARLEIYDRALTYSLRALAINPNLFGVRQNIEVLERLIRERRQQTI